MLIDKLRSYLRLNFFNSYSDNYDYYRFGNRVRKSSFLRSVKVVTIYAVLINHFTFKKFINLFFGSGYFTKLEFLYNNLADDFSKELIIRLLAYRLIGFKRIKLMDDTKSYFLSIESLNKLASHEFFMLSFSGFNWKMSHFSLEKAGFPLKLFYTSQGIYTTFILKQYEYGKVIPAIKAQKGDFVIDAGGCFGDTALYFANEVGSDGKVFTFEFVPDNIKILKRNVSLNSSVQNVVQIIENPLWETSDKPVYFKNNGPASRLGFEPFEGYESIIKTISIDDFVDKEKIDKIDFIKMDIEGSELSALKGSINTIKKFKPRLAISIYHSLNDFVDIIEYLDKNVPQYQFYLGHYTLHLEETILFAIKKN